MPDLTHPTTTLRMGARGSLLSRVQSQGVADALERTHPGLRVQLVVYKTTGDRLTQAPLADAGGKGLFTKELEQALLAGQIDFAVHSMKDVPVTMPLVDQSNLIIAAVPERADWRDVLVSAGGRGLADLPAGARVGTGSLRRRCQLLERRPDVVVELIRGNIDTRLRKRDDGAYDAILLAMAGLQRAGLFDAATMAALGAEEMLPAAGQGALAIQCRRDDAATRGLLGAMNDPVTARCVGLEREVVLALAGDCHSPIAALADEESGRVRLRAAAGAAGGAVPVVRAEASGEGGEGVVSRVVEMLKDRGAWELLHGGA